MVNKQLQSTVLTVVENQISMDSPPITKTTFNRLKKGGSTADIAKKKIAAVLLEELYSVMKDKKEFDEKRYADRLSALE